MNWKASRLPACTAPASTIRISRSITISSAPITCRRRQRQNRGGDAGQPPAEVQLPYHSSAGLGLGADPVSGAKIDREQLLRYLVSFRHHNEFHEQCVERIFNDILRFCQPESLSVYARYTRRGGLDINPWRSNGDFSPPPAASPVNNKQFHNLRAFRRAQGCGNAVRRAIVITGRP